MAKGRILKYIKNPKWFLLYLDNHNIIKLKDETYLKLEYSVYLNKKLDLNDPKTFNEKIQWLKLNDRKDIYTKLVDKYEAKKIASELIGDEYIIPTIGIYDAFDDIRFDELPDQFVIKCTHDSGGIAICKDKSSFDLDKARRYIEKRLKINYFKMHREWPYKNVKPRIIIEKYMEDKTNKDLKDYKFFVFNGLLSCIQVDYDRFVNHKRAFYDTNWNRLKFTTCYPTDYSIEIEKPNNFEKMKQIVNDLVKQLNNPPFIRIDLYTINNDIFFGEFTLYHGAGLEKFIPENWDLELGNKIDLKGVGTK